MKNQDNPSPDYSERIAQQQSEIEKIKAANTQLHQALAAHQKAAEEHKIIEERYRQSQVRFRTIFEQSQLGSKILAPDLKIIEVNEALISMLGYDSKSDLINRKIIEFAHPNFVANWQELQTRLWEKRLPSFSIDTCLLKKDQSSLWCHVTSILFEDDQQTLGYTVIENIDDRKALEAKAQRLYEDQEMMMYLVAHDLKSPLHIINTLSGLIRDDMEAGDQPHAFRSLSLLQQTCNRAYQITNDLVLIGELETREIEKQQVNIGDLLSIVTDQVRTIAREKDIQIIQFLPPTPVLAWVNQEKMGRVLENLLSNAVKFSMPGKQIQIVLEQRAAHLLLKVIDQGIGIPLALQPVIFNKFTKAKRKGTQGEETTGLGLFIAKRIMDIHHGKIWCESRPEKGATFFIRLPALKTAAG